MTTIVVGGHSRNVGKTSIVAAIIAAWPEYSWTAVKMSSHWHGDGADADGKDKKEICRVDEEHDRNSGTDTGRFLAAGASRSFWIRIREGCMEQALPQFMPVLHSNPYVIVESNGIVKHIQPSLYLMVHRYDVEDYKDSARETIRQAHAVIALKYRSTTPAWKGISHDVSSAIPVFPVSDPHVLPQDLIEFIRLRLV
jgi:molybdopterin-guanine dinucleotide biosynthesis protein